MQFTVWKPIIWIYNHYCTEIPEININLLPNACNFHPKFRFILSLHFSENAQNVHFREAKFQNFPGEHAPGPPLVYSRLPPSILFLLDYSQLLPPGLLLPLSNTQYDDYVSYVRKKTFLFSAEKRVHLPYYTGLHILRTANIRSAQA